MAAPISERMRQIHIGLGPEGYLPVGDKTADSEVFSQEQAAQEAFLLANCPPGIWPHGSYQAGCPRPILISKGHNEQLTFFHCALMAAINDIVPRWWKDKDAKFPERMPLEEKEEELLQWMQEQQDLGKLRTFQSLQGSWRPDFLVEEVEASDGSITENFRLSEINARFCFNGFMHCAYGTQALGGRGMETAGLTFEFFEGLLGLFDNDKTVHLVKGVEDGFDITMFMHAVKQRLGKAPRLIRPDDLRLVEDKQGNVKLCCLATSNAAAAEIFHNAAGEAVEEIHRVGLELHQRELIKLDRDMWRQISLRCFNDMRTILLVHDKRMLGIILQELDGLVARNIITAQQAAALDRGIATTILPGSPELRQLASLSDDVRGEYILKPVRSGKGAGIVFCDETTADEWRSALNGLVSASLSDGGRLVVQRRVKQQLYDIILKKNGQVGRYPLVGTYHVVNGGYIGIGTWRSSPDRICAISNGGSWICTVMAP